MGGLKAPLPKRNYWKDVPNSGSAAIRSFTPQMFIICMGTGVLAALLHNNGYQFRGLEIISTIVWILDIIFFAAISLTFITRWIRYPGATARLFESEVEQTAYLSTTTIAAATIVELLALICGSRWDNWQYASFGLWWGVVLMSIVSATATYWLLVRDEKVAIDNLAPTLLYPTTGLLATATAGSVVVSYTPLTIGLSMPVVVVSYFLLGAGFIMCLLTMSALFLRLLHNQTPEPKKVAAQMIPLAPFSNAAYSFITLGYLAGPKKHVFDYYSKGPIASTDISDGLYAAGLVFGLTLWGFATFWLIFALVAFIRDVGKTRFNLNMWSAAYPFGAYGIVATQFAIDFDSPTFRVVSSIILVFMVLLWLWLVLSTLPMVISGELLLGEAWEEMQKDKEKKAEEGRAREEGGGEETERQGGKEGRRRGGRERSRVSDAETAVNDED